MERDEKRNSKEKISAEKKGKSCLIAEQRNNKNKIERLTLIWMGDAKGRVLKTIIESTVAERTQFE